MTQAPKRKIKLLAFGDSPAVPSGFGTVMKNIFYHLGNSGKYDIDIIGVNDRGNYKDPQEYPYHLYQACPPGEMDVHGRSRFVDIVRGGGIDLQPPWDLIFMLNDPFILESVIPYFNLGTIPALKDIQKTHYLKLPPHMWFKTVGYFPVDSNIKPHWVERAIGLVDYPVTYTKWGKYQIELADKQLDKPTDINPKVIYHGHNPDNFHPLPENVVNRFRQDYFAGAVRPDTFLVTVIARNQNRKDIPRAMRIFKEFHRRRPDSFLYIHADESENWGSLMEVASMIGLKHGTDWNYPQDFISNKGFPHHILNAILNAADVNLSTTQGEGWGLPITEAMATKTINLAPHHSSIPELFNLTHNESDLSIDNLIKLKARGISIKAGSTSSEWICHGSNDLERLRPLTNVDDAVNKLFWIYDHPKEIKTITMQAHRWINTYPWSTIAKRWDKLFQKAYRQLESERQHPDKAIKSWQSYRLPSQSPPDKAPHLLNR